MIRPVRQALEEPLAAQPQVQVEQQAQVRDPLAQAARLEPVQPVPVEPLVQAARRVVLAEPVVQVRPVAPVAVRLVVAVRLAVAQVLVRRLRLLPIRSLP